MIGSAAIKILRRSKLAKATAKQKPSPLKPSVSQGQAGFTLLELLVVVIMVGVIATIAAPGWLGFVNQRRVSAANDTVLRALQDAQSQAKTKKVNYNTSLRNLPGQAPEIAVYPAKQIDSTGNLVDVDPTATGFKMWKSLGQDLAIKPNQVMLRTNVGTAAQANQVVRQALGSGADIGTITFDEMGALSQDTNPDLVGTGTATAPKGLIIMAAVPNGTNPIPSTQRCVIVKTLLGSLQIQKGDQCNF